MLAARLAVAAVGAAGLAWAWVGSVGHPPVAGAVALATAAAAAAPAPPVAALVAPPGLQERFVSGDEEPHVHGVAAYAAPDGSVTAYWNGGSIEGARDVAIYEARFDGAGWSGPRVVLERHEAEAQLGRSIKKLGNVSVHRHPDGRLWLVFVSVSYGGWAGSALNLMESADGGRSWSHARRLVTSPMLNLSTLARGSAAHVRDGSVVLPIYHEFAGKFGEMLHLTPDGHVLAKTRLSSGRVALQPEIVFVGEGRAVAWMRNPTEPRRVWRSTSDDEGRTWTDPVPTALPNPDAPIDVTSAEGGRLLAVLNDQERGRERLVLATTGDEGRTWRTVFVLEDRERHARGKATHEYSYPWLMRDAAGRYHVLYTWNRRRIKHVTFDARWLATAEAAADAAAAASDAATTPRE